MKESIFISWHYTTHGIAYFKHILSAFYTGEVSLSEEWIENKGISQAKMNKVFDKENSQKYRNGFLFDKAYVLHAEESIIYKVTDRRYHYRRNMLEDTEVVRTKMVDIWDDVINNWEAVLKSTGKPIKAEHLSKEGEVASVNRQDSITMEDEINYVRQTYPDKADLFEEQLWRDMQHYTVSDQVWWFKNKSNAQKKYDSGRFKTVALSDITDMRNEQNIIQALFKWFNNIVQQHSEDAHYIINTSLGTSEVQVAWYILAQSGRLPRNTRFLKTHDDKSDRTNKRFKLFSIKEYPPQLLSTINASLNIYQGDLSKKRQLVSKKLATYYDLGFAILIFGERGTGKSSLVKRLGEESDLAEKVIKEINCASIDDDSKAESDFFGHKKGAFTGADADKKGLFEEAKGGLIFFDEIHHLSKRVQGKLMKALQTDKDNQYSFRPLGATEEQKTEFRAIFATNLSLPQLKEALLPDFFDRIAQLIITLPPLRETSKDRMKDWAVVWGNLRFEEVYSQVVPATKPLKDWLQQLSLPGNYRDLQKIAIAYMTYLRLPDEVKKLEPCKSPLEFAQKQYEHYHYEHFREELPGQAYLSDLFDPAVLALNGEKTNAKKILEKRYNHALIDWVETNYPHKKAHELLDISEATCYNWKKEKK